MTNTPRIGLVGATGALGTAILDQLSDIGWDLEVQAFARASTRVPTVSFGESTLPVDDVDDMDLPAFDVVVVAAPREAAARWVDAAVSAGCAVVDASGARLDDLRTPLMAPWGPQEPPGGEWVSDVLGVPSAAGSLLSAVLQPLADRVGVRSAEAVVLLPASHAGRDGVEELSRQVVTLFNSQPPPRRVFPHGLAFDLLPLCGQPGPSGWTDLELRVSAEVGRLTGVKCDVTLVGVPVFSGISATLTVTSGQALDADQVGRTLSEAGVRLSVGADGRALPRPRRVEGEPAVSAARLRPSLSGRGLHLWAGQDNLRGAAVSVVGAIEHLLVRRGVLAR